MDAAGPPPDKSATEADIAGPAADFRAFYERHAGWVYSLSLRMAADPVAAREAVQDVFVRAWRKAELYREAQGVVAHTAGRAVRIAGASGFLEVFTGEGAVEVMRCTVTQATFTTLSGPIDSAADLAPNALVRFDSYVGAVELRLSLNVDASFELSTFGGTIVNEFGPSARKSSDYAPGKELNFTRGPGSSRILIDTYGGDIRLLAR